MVSHEGIPKPGDILSDKYEVTGVLGAGGMGVVVAARHLDLNQRVAIKFLNAQFARHPAAVARFMREARAAAGIQSEHVTRVLDVTRTADGSPYLVMEYMVGTDLEKHLRARGPLPIEETVDYVLQACEALAEAHAAGIVHRDLKPGNLFLTHRADGSALVKVLDFGMSKVMAPEEGALDGSLTSASEMLGSPWYMSPEQVRSSKNVDARTDIWSLGVVLHKLLTGTQAFESETLSSCLAKIAADAPTPLRAKRPDAPAELEAVIQRCLEKDLTRRVQNVAELAMALLPFAPARSRISAERAMRVLVGSDVLTEETLPLAAVGAVRAPSEPTPAPAAMVTSSVTPALPAGVPARSRGPLVVVALVACAALAAAAMASTSRTPAPPAVPAAATAAQSAAPVTPAQVPAERPSSAPAPDTATPTATAAPAASLPRARPAPTAVRPIARPVIPLYDPSDTR